MTPQPPLAGLSNPRISVVVCNYNYERYVRQTIDSVLQQTYPPLEVIVVDDGSSDGSLAVIHGYEAQGIKVIAQANGGQIAAYNAGFEQARGDVVLFLDSDDALLPGALAEIATHFGEGVAKVHFRLELIGPNGEQIGATIPHELAQGEVATVFLKHGVPHASPPASGNAYRHSVLGKIFPLPADAQDRHGADFFCIFGATLFGTVSACQSTLGLYRIHRLPSAESSFTFGNAAKGLSLDKRLQARIERFGRWIAERSQGTIQAPTTLLDFSNEKSAYASTALAGKGWWTDTRATLARLPRLVRSIVVRNDYSVFKKAGLIAWSLVVLLAPRNLATKAARYVCDPGSRGPARRQGVMR
ncbi:glycosyltransferase family A protein [Aquabacterium sp.]|uniref:glycosyltransferase family 2 protein n=1 Tax=Aquabacterium sp. TaxID=1872578 RepID=UPI0019A44ABF|nr:glycosyltransferase family A protein [Aquabacterium sp.]MBC7700160.1 glycosyltransferase family 2 protein [Aquabacterium sp.]